ncbi:hypothetical protein BDV36DRAFT_279210 [Aspergillus pseudocaelatus]|uniref:Rhodopsin domain-containing protein n=1 Tax=Aspergillus pseudocaelatus TaxID=1825620 RepID=A0ABQ6X4X0_9EURO|nr:hypothetical protein BDV36DRAFT_279210 [Aspergillus pseudocaelatus]
MKSRDTNRVSSSPSYESKQAVLCSITIIFMILETIAVILRFVSRRIGKVSWSRDDTLIIISWVVTIAFNVTILVDVRYGGTGLHMARMMETDPAMSVYFSKDIIPVGPTWLFSVALWDTTVSGRCFNLNLLLRWIRLPHILSDVIMLILPISHIIKLQTTRRIKLGLLITFLLGSVGFVFGLVCWVQYFITDAIADKTWSAVDIFIWSVMEAGMYLIAACLLAYQPLVSLIWRQIKKRLVGMSITKSEQASTRDYQTGSGSHDQIPDGRAFVPLSDKEEYIGLVTVAKVKHGQRYEVV